MAGDEMSRPVSIRACGRAERERRAFVANENDARPFARAVARSPAALVVEVWRRDARTVCARLRAALFREANRENDRTRSRDDDDDARFVFVVCVSVLIIITCVRVGRGGKKNKVSDRARRLSRREPRRRVARVASRPTQKPFDFWKD